MLRPKNVILQLRRFKHRRDHWSMVRKKIYPKDRALTNFDEFYGSIFGIRWNSMRLALLCEHKYMAIVNNFGDAEKTIEKLEATGAINVRTLYNITKERIEKGELPQMHKIEEKFTKIDERLQATLAKRQAEEIQTFYPQEREASLNYIPETIDTMRQSPADNESTLVEPESRDRRIIDPEISEGLLEDFMPATRMKGLEDWVFESDHYKYYNKNTDFPLKIEPELELHFPENLHIYTYERSNVDRFSSPKKCITGSFSHYLLDGASILPPLALGIEPGDKVLDACAAPGGKSLIMLQTLYPDVLVCNDIPETRVKRIRKIMEDFVFDFRENWQQKRCFIVHEDARLLTEYKKYDKVLVDVPCTTDRHCLNENENNIFKPTRMNERLKIPELQAGILENCLKLVKVGGSLVYSTCSLSPVQNDGVVQMALSNAFRESGISVVIKDLTDVMKPFVEIFKFENPRGLKYGQMVIPFLPLNFGPMYFCKMTRIS
ncbi:5-methylcytosine rRNA methyltransferase NSUN4 [Lutzomyia longipalpis]|uniref:5-methylcytosine rRNA methyltransferase NSUN4 n=1 Tax=Lutzomyia longipalpis TaxID=7200 RepID=UPI00248335BD|nr:5-methylcytosine rRNA methyltransferase NSUN4 [Lutzomyia longipalpis]